MNREIEGKDADGRKEREERKKKKKQTYNNGKAGKEKLIFLSKKTQVEGSYREDFFFVFLTKGRSFEMGFFLQNFVLTII